MTPSCRDAVDGAVSSRGFRQFHCYLIKFISVTASLLLYEIVSYCLLVCLPRFLVFILRNLPGYYSPFKNLYFKKDPPNFFFHSLSFPLSNLPHLSSVSYDLPNCSVPLTLASLPGSPPALSLLTVSQSLLTGSSSICLMPHSAREEGGPRQPPLASPVDRVEHPGEHFLPPPSQRT